MDLPMFSGGIDLPASLGSGSTWRGHWLYPLLHPQGLHSSQHTSAAWQRGVNERPKAAALRFCVLWAKLWDCKFPSVLQVGRLLARAGVSRDGEGAGWVPREGEKRLDRQGPPTNSPEAHGESGLGAHPHRTLQSLCSGGSSTQDRTGHTESASASSEGGVGLIPDKGTEIPLAVWCDQKKVKFRTMPDPGTHSIIMLALGVSLVLVLTGFEEGNGSIQPG